MFAGRFSNISVETVDFDKITPHYVHFTMDDKTSVTERFERAEAAENFAWWLRREAAAAVIH